MSAMSRTAGGAGAPAVLIRRLRREFVSNGSPRVAVNDLDLALEPREIHGLLGPNGAGKTTLCKILSTLLLPTSGSAEILGIDVAARPAAVRPLLGIMFGGERGLYTRLTARQNLIYWAALYRQPRAAARAQATALIERVGLASRADERVETYSRGMKQRLHLARSLIGNPRVLILDEPTTGMDPAAAGELRDLVRQLRAEGRTILVTTHDMAEAEAICDRVSLMDRGRLLATEDPAMIGKLMTTYERITAEGVTPQLAARLRALPGVASVTEQSGSAVVQVSADGAATVVLAELVSAGVTTMQAGFPSLEEVYIHMIGDRGLVV